MDSVEIIKKLSLHYLVTHDMPLQIQLGLPYLEKKNGSLYMSFKAHKEVFNKGCLEYYSPEYELVWKFPFDHIVEFRELENATNQAPKLVGNICEKKMLSTGLYSIKELYDACSRVLTFWENTGTVSDLIMSKYQKQYEDTIRQLGMQEVYLQEKDGKIC